MKKKMIFFLGIALSCLQWSYAQNECFPDEEGIYKYYANLTLDYVSEDFGIADFFAHIEVQASPEIFAVLESSIVDVEKAFPDAETPFLQQAVSVYAMTNDLEDYLLTIPESIHFAELLCMPEEMLLFEPNDYALIASNQSTHLDLIKAPEAWEITKGDNRVFIGITDTYIDETHEDLEHKIEQVLQNAIFPNGHGTAVSGLAAADTDNGLGLASVGFESKIIFSSRLYVDNEVLKIAKIPGVRVVNFSWINGCSASVNQQMIYSEILNIHNVVPVSGAGNKPDHCGDNALVFPAAYDEVISVTSVGHINPIGHEHDPPLVDPFTGDPIPHYNWKDCHELVIDAPESTHHHNDKVNIAAPGYDVYTTANDNNYARAVGTSHAAPQVAGVCALIAAVNPCLTGPQIKDIVLTTADPSIYQLECNEDYIGLLGSGRLDAYQAVKKALDLGTLYIQNKTYNSGTTTTEFAETLMHVGSQVTTSLPFGLVTVKENSDVTFQATRTITLSSGFTVETDAIFTVNLIDSPCF
ncbi:MAG: S8 family serine peptidase [Chitinophagales bacterium]|nr:S8 family serine peptidase [Chitinophagales bacterium]